MKRRLYRFQCDCFAPSDAMDIEVIALDEKGESKFFIINMFFTETGFFARLKYAFLILCGNWNWREFVVREEDTRLLSDIFNPDRKFSVLPDAERGDKMSYKDG